MKPSVWRAYISIPIANLDSLPLGEEGAHVGRGWHNTESYCAAAQAKQWCNATELTGWVCVERERKKMWANHNSSCYYRIERVTQTGHQEMFTSGDLRGYWRILDVHFKQLANWQINPPPPALSCVPGGLCIGVTYGIRLWHPGLYQWFKRSGEWKLLSFVATISPCWIPGRTVSYSVSPVHSRFPFIYLRRK